MCSDPGGRPGLDDLRYALDSFPELDPGLSGPEKSCTPSIRTVPISANDLRVYRVEKKTRDSFFDLDSVDEVNEFPVKAISDMSNNPTQPKRLTKANLLVRDSKQDRSCLPRVRINNQKLRMNNSRARSVCSDQEEWKTNRAISVCSEQAVYFRPRATGDTAFRQHLVTPRGYGTDERSAVSVCDSSKQADYFRVRPSTQREIFANKCIISPREYCTDELSDNAYIELVEKSDSESDSLIFVEPKDDEREPLNGETLLKFLAIENHNETSISPSPNSLFKTNKVKPDTPNISGTDSTSLRSSGSLANSSGDRYQRDDCSFVYPKYSNKSMKRDDNSVDIIFDSLHPSEAPMLSSEKTTDNEVELDHKKCQHILITGKMNSNNDVEGGLIFSTRVTDGILHRDFVDPGDAESINKNVELP